MTTAVLLMAYGSPTKMEDLMTYLEGIYEGKPVPQYAIDENTAKYRMVDGVSPSNSIIDTLVSKLNGILKNDGDYRVYLGNKHWNPSLDEAVSRIARDGCNRIVAIPLFPFRSHNVEKSYRDPLEESLKKYSLDVEITFINGFEDEELFYSTWIEILSSVVVDQTPETLYVFSAHSLPIFSHNEEEYMKSFMDSADRIAQTMGIRNYSAVFQSRGKYGSRWLEPNIYEVTDNLENRISKVITVPIGFLYDHLEILYDLDTEFGEKVRELNREYSRTGLPNFSPTFLLALRNIILKNSSQ